jgi:hypothetical protein
LTSDKFNSACSRLLTINPLKSSPLK